MMSDEEFEKYKQDHDGAEPSVEEYVGSDEEAAETQEHAPESPEVTPVGEESVPSAQADLAEPHPDTPEFPTPNDSPGETTPSHAFNATPDGDLSADAGTAEPGQTPAPAGVAVEGAESTIPASSDPASSDPVTDSEPVASPDSVTPPAHATPGGSPEPVTGEQPVVAPPEQPEPVSPPTPPEGTRSLHEIISDELGELRRAISTLSGNSASAQPGTFVHAAILHIRSVVARLEDSARASGVKIDPQQ